MSIFKRLSLCSVFASLLFVPSFAQHLLGAFSGLAVRIDTQIESPVQNNDMRTLPEQKAGDTIRFQLFAPEGGGQSTNGYTVELDLPGHTFSSYIGIVSGTDWTGGALIGTGSTSLSALFPTAASVPSTGYLGQVDLQVTRSLEGGETLIVKSLSMTSGSDVDALDVSNAAITFTASATGSGDFDGNGTVNLADFLAFVEVFGKSSSEVGYDARMDFDGNGIVNLADFLAFVEVFGTTPFTGGGQGGGGSSVAPPPPGNVKYQWDPSILRYTIYWDPVPDATSYRVYYDHASLLSVSCPGGCRRIATVSDTSIAHVRKRWRIGYWVRACNDAGCSNYVRAAKGDDIGSDLIVKSASVSNDSLNEGQSFTLNVTVRNQGNRQSPATILRYYRSSDQLISMGDTEVGADAVSSLSSSGATSKSISLIAESSFYYGACVEAVKNERNIKNNCFSSIPVIVRGQPLTPSPPPPIIELENGSPEGITYANDRFYVVDWQKVYGYLSSGQRVPASDFALHKVSFKGITYASDRFYVVGYPENKVYGYLSSGQRDPASDFDLSPDQSWPEGITYANDRFFVVDDFRGKVFAYLSSGQRDPASDFALSAANTRSRGITYANDRFYVVGYFGKVFAYLSSGQRDPASDFSLSVANTRPKGITYGNGRFYVVVQNLGAVGRIYVVVNP